MQYWFQCVGPGLYDVSGPYDRDLQDPAIGFRRIPLPRRWVNRRYDASSVDDPGYTDTVHEDFDRITDLSEAEGWDRRVVRGPRRPGHR
jgi:hypothetical protein